METYELTTQEIENLEWQKNTEQDDITIKIMDWNVDNNR